MFVNPKFERNRLGSRGSSVLRTVEGAVTAFELLQVLSRRLCMV